MFRNAKTGEITVGADNKVEQCTYIAAITRVEEELTNELTGGWKVIEVGYVAHSFLVFRLLMIFFAPDGTEECAGISLKTNTLISIHYLISHTIEDHAITTLNGFDGFI
jgi:hypothetical protein